MLIKYKADHFLKMFPDGEHRVLVDGEKITTVVSLTHVRVRTLNQKTNYFRCADSTFLQLYCL